MSPEVDTIRRRWLIAVVLFAGTLLLFSRAIGNGFVNYDDPEYVTKNEHVKAGLTATGVRWAMSAGAVSNWHPLTWVSHMVDVSLFGLSPSGHHVTSVLLHALNAAVLFAALWRLSRALWPSAVVAALFAWHPLRVESVAWIAERKDVLSGFLGLLTVWFYAAYVDHRRVASGRDVRWYVAALLAFGLGLTAKPMLVTLPCILLLLDYWPLQRFGSLSIAGAAGSRRLAAARAANWGNLRALVIEKLPFFALAGASSVATYLVQREGGSVSVSLGLGARVANAVVAVARYLGRMVWPLDLAVLDPHPGSWPLGIVIFSVGLGAVISVVAWRQRIRRPWIIVGWLWFVGALVPVLGFVQVGLQSMADRYTYLPGIGIGLALVWSLRESARLAPRAGVAVLAFALMGVGLLTWRQIGYWRNSLTLFDHAIAVTRNNYLAYNNRGLFRFEAGEIGAGMADYRRSLAINPEYADANNNLGHALAQLDRPAEAIPFYRAALKAKPNHVEIHNNLGNALSDVGAIDEAIEHYRFVLARDPRHVNALNGYGVALAMQGRAADAIAQFDAVLTIDPDNVSAHSNRGNACAMLGRNEEAIRHYRRALALAGSDARTYYNLGNVLSAQGDWAGAAENFRRAVELRAENPDAHASLGLALARLGQRDAALRHLRTALQQRPDFPQAKAWLAAVEAAPAK